MNIPQDAEVNLREVFGQVAAFRWAILVSGITERESHVPGFAWVARFGVKAKTHLEETMKRFKLTILTLICTLQALAGIDITGTFRPVESGRNLEVAGQLVMVVRGNDFVGASPTKPIYLALQLEHGLTLAQTRVSDEASVIHLASILDTDDPDASINMPANAISIVRWMSGENAIWLRVTSDSSTWVRQNGMPSAPNESAVISTHLGISAEQGAKAELAWERGLANARNHENLWGPVSTLLGVNTMQAQPDTEGFYRFNCSAYDENTVVTGSFFAVGNALALDISTDGAIAQYTHQADGQWLYHITPGNALFTTTLTMVNMDYLEHATVAELYSSSGHLLEEVVLTAPTGSNLTATIQDWFQRGDISHIHFRGGPNCLIKVGYRIATGQGATAHVNASTTDATRFVISPGEGQYVFDGLAAVNKGQEAAEVHARFLGSGGLLLGESQLAAPQTFFSNSKKLWVLDEMTPVGTELIVIESTQPLGCVFLRVHVQAWHLDTCSR